MVNNGLMRNNRRDWIYFEFISEQDQWLTWIYAPGFNRQVPLINQIAQNHFRGPNFDIILRPFQPPLIQLPPYPLQLSQVWPPIQQYGQPFQQLITITIIQHSQPSSMQFQPGQRRVRRRQSHQKRLSCPPPPQPPLPPTLPHQLAPLQIPFPQRRPPPIPVSIPINYRPLGVPPGYNHSFWFRLRGSTLNNGSVSIRVSTFSERQKRIRRKKIGIQRQQPAQSNLKPRVQKQQRNQLCSSELVNKRGLRTSKFPNSSTVFSPAVGVNGYYNNNHHPYNWIPRPPANIENPPNWHMTHYLRRGLQLRRRKCECKMIPVRFEILHNNIGLPQLVMNQAPEGEDDEDEQEEEEEEEEDKQLDEIFSDDDHDHDDDDHHRQLPNHGTCVV